MQTPDQRIYSKLVQIDGGPQEQQFSNTFQYGAGFLLHLILKCVPIGFFLFRFLFSGLIGNLIITQLIIIFVVIDFWFTKNITGRLLAGMKWEFEDDRYGVERFKFQKRVNEGYINPFGAKLFWIVLIIYTVLPIIIIIVILLLNTSIYYIRIDEILLNFAISLGGAINLYFFLRVNRGASDRKLELINKLGNDFIKKLGGASMVSFI